MLESLRRPGGGRRQAGIGLLVVLAIAVLNSALLFLHRATRTGLETELALRLENVASVLAISLDPDRVERAGFEVLDLSLREASPESLLVAPAFDSLRATLQAVLEVTELANVRLFDATGSSFLDLAIPALETRRRDALDPAAVAAALAGTTAHGQLYRSQGEYLMAGYAPIRDGFGSPVAALGVEADARYFGALRRLRFAIGASAGLSVLVLVGLGTWFARLQSSLARAESALQHSETLAMMGRLTAGIAHEIRNPLGIITATAQRLQKRYDDPNQPDEKFSYIGEEVARLNAILTGYLQFAKDEPTRLEPLDLVPLVEHSLRFLAPELEAPHIELETALPETCPVRGDRQRLQQVLWNLTLNSVQAMPEGGRLRVCLEADAGGARLTVEDSGGGIAPEIRARLFEPFVTTKEKGSGLGLTIVRRIVEQHGGHIRLVDAEGGGTRAEITLPAA